MSVLVTHPTGNANVRAVLRAAHQAELLDSFWTTLAVPEWLALTRELGRRSYLEIPWSQIHLRPLREMIRLANRRMRIETLGRHETGFCSVDGVYRALDRSVALAVPKGAANGLRAVYAYEDGALETFRQCQELGIARIYDLPAAHWRTFRNILEEERALKPDWAPTMGGLLDSSAKLDRKDEEIERANKIVVASSFTRKSLEKNFGLTLDVVVTPYGAPRPRRRTLSERGKDDPLLLLFAGRLAQNKGVSYLIAALRLCAFPWHLTLAGAVPDAIPDELRGLLDDPRCDWLGHIPHATLLEQMDKAHVFVFPSLAEGFGLVLLEAMSAGLPVITTPHTAGPDIMTDGDEGFIVPIRDSAAIAERLHLLYEDESLRMRMGTDALETARRSGWERYERQIADLLRSVQQ